MAFFAKRVWCDWLSYYDYNAVKWYLCTMMSKCKWSGTAQYLTLNSWTRTLYSSIRFSETWITCIYIKKPQNSLRSAEPVHRLCRRTYVTQLEKYYITSSQDQSCPRVHFLFTLTRQCEITFVMFHPVVAQKLTYRNDFYE